MLDPDDRSLLCDALKPPVGCRFDQAVATTYSLDLLTLLTIPLHLVRFSAGQSIEDLLRDEAAVGLYEALQRTAHRLSIFCHGGRIQAPRAACNPLVHLLEGQVHESSPPGGGAFHAKLWVLRYVETGAATDAPVHLRLLILTRNLTADRSWDLSLHLDGMPGGRLRAENRALGEMIAALPGMAHRRPDQRAFDRCQLLGDEVRRTEWELPPGFESAAFHVLGISQRPWMPEPSKRLVVISPFVGGNALQRLAGTTGEPIALVSREEELDRLSPESRALFPSIHVLADAADSDDGEEGEGSAAGGTDTRLHGLHAKALITEDGWSTTLYVGSANATDQALLSGRNLEIMVQLTGRRSKVGGVESFLAAEAMGPLLMPYQPNPVAIEEDALLEAEAILEKAREILAGGELELHCRLGADGLLSLRLVPRKPLLLPPLESLSCWLITLSSDTARDAFSLSRGEAVDMGTCSLTALTSFVAFRASVAGARQDVTFVVFANLVNPPQERGAAILESILRTTEGFYRYLLLLLAGDSPESPSGGGDTGDTSQDWRWLTGLGGGGLPLLEELVRAYSREPSKLRRIRSTMEELRKLPNAAKIIPEDFQSLWRTVDEALESQP